MISSFFTKTKPINYLVLLIALLVFYLLNFLFINISSENNLLFTAFFIALILQVVGVQEIVRTRKTTSTTSFAMLFFVLLCMSIPQILNYKEVVFCNLFLMLSLNRLLALKNLVKIKQKIFDTTFWICVASIFDPWALFFLLVVFLAVYIYGAKEFKNWLVPFMASIIFLLIVFAFVLLTKNLDFLKEHYFLKVPSDFLDNYIQHFSIKPFIFIFLVGLIIILVFIKQGYQGTGRLAHLRLLLPYFLIGTAVFILRPTEANNFTLLLYTFFPATIFATNFLETFKRKRLREGVLLACILTPFILLAIGVVK